MFIKPNCRPNWRAAWSMARPLKPVGPLAMMSMLASTSLVSQNSSSSCAFSRASSNGRENLVGRCRLSASLRASWVKVLSSDSPIGPLLSTICRLSAMLRYWACLVSVSRFDHRPVAGQDDDEMNLLFRHVLAVAALRHQHVRVLQAEAEIERHERRLLVVV